MKKHKSKQGPHPGGAPGNVDPVSFIQRASMPFPNQKSSTVTGRKSWDRSGFSPEVKVLFDTFSFKKKYYFRLSATATATATVAPTMGLLPMPKKPIISTWAGTELEPANWASECIRPMVSVMP